MDDAPAYRPVNDDAPHVALFLLAAAICLGWAALDQLLGASNGGRGVHLACLAAAGLTAGSIVFEARLVVRQARAIGICVVSLCAVVVVVALARHGSAAAVVCGIIGIALACGSVAMMRGPLWAGYIGSLRVKD